MSEQNIDERPVGGLKYTIVDRFLDRLRNKDKNKAATILTAMSLGTRIGTTPSNTEIQNALMANGDKAVTATFTPETPTRSTPIPVMKENDNLKPSGPVGTDKFNWDIGGSAGDRSIKKVKEAQADIVTPYTPQTYELTDESWGKLEKEFNLSADQQKQLDFALSEYVVDDGVNITLSPNSFAVGTSFEGDLTNKVNGPDYAKGNPNDIKNIFDFEKDGSLRKLPVPAGQSPWLGRVDAGSAAALTNLGVKVTAETYVMTTVSVDKNNSYMFKVVMGNDGKLYGLIPQDSNYKKAVVAFQKTYGRDAVVIPTPQPVVFFPGNPDKNFTEPGAIAPEIIKINISNGTYELVNGTTGNIDGFTKGEKFGIVTAGTAPSADVVYQNRVDLSEKENGDIATIYLDFGKNQGLNVGLGSKDTTAYKYYPSLDELSSSLKLGRKVRVEMWSKEDFDNKYFFPDDEVTPEVAWLRDHSQPLATIKSVLQRLKAGEKIPSDQLHFNGAIVIIN